jgi:hypothetical protein
MIMVLESNDYDAGVTVIVSDSDGYDVRKR